jgi:hypothetical protein
MSACVLEPIWKCTANYFLGQGNNMAVPIYLPLSQSATLHDCL